MVAIRLDVSITFKKFIHMPPWTRVLALRRRLRAACLNLEEGPPAIHTALTDQTRGVLRSSLQRNRLINSAPPVSYGWEAGIISLHQ